jgi:gliding motility-associated-like protein
VQISLVISDPQGCSGLVRLELPNPAEIVPAFSVKNITCSGKKDGEITITSNQGDNPITGYLWNTGVLTSSTANLQPGTYRVTLTDSKGCTGTGSANVTEPDPLSVQINATSVVCFGDANGSATATPAGGTPGYAFLWSNGNTTATTSQLASAFYLLTLTDANGCVLIDSTLVGSPLQPELAITAMAPDCYNTPKGRIEVQISGGNAPYQYSVNNGNYTGSPIFLALKSGDYTVQVKDNKGCLYQGAVIVAQPDPVVVSIDPTEAAVTYGDTLRLNAITTGTQGFVNFEWESVILEPFNCDNATGCASMAFLPSIENTVFVLATDEKGCTGTAEMHLTVDKPQEIYVPTGFTPNGDANNGLLNVFGKSRQVKTILSFKVFDRWGELVYSDTEIPINDLNRGWDGTFRGKDCEPGVFVWTLEAEYQDGSKKSFHGQTTLIR